MKVKNPPPGKQTNWRQEFNTNEKEMKHIPASHLLLMINKCVYVCVTAVWILILIHRARNEQNIPGAY